MPKILVSDSLSKEGLEVLENAKGLGVDFAYKPGLKEDELAAAIVEYDGLVIRSGSKVTAKVLEAAGKLKVVGRAGIGVDNVDVPVATRRGIIVMNTPTGNTITTAEHAVALLFAVARKLGMADATMKQGKWEKKKLEGRELTGKTLGVIGLGNIGRIVADRGRGLRMRVIAFDPVLTAERAQELGVELVSLDELFARADAITLHTPRTPQTLNLINDQSIAKMKKGVLLINAARGGICEEAAVVRGLESGQIGGAGFDVFVQEPPGLTDLIKHPNVVATPHLGASTEEAQTRVAVEICEQVIAYLVHGTISNSVNVPAVPREQAALLTPYVTLGRRLGQFLGANENITPRCISVEFGGEAADLLTKPVVNAAVAGVLAHYLEDEINEISAPLVAKDRGIEIREQTSSEKTSFASLLRIVVTSNDGRQVRVSGTLGSNRASRIVGWGDFEMDASLEGTILVLQNEDRPGVIGTVGTILGESKINVARMQVALDIKSRKAVQLWSLDSNIDDNVLNLVRAAKDVQNATAVIVS
jgi:D-3-phosphoglycerate dehydrogenase / 2-oxoglutarate reductase